MKRVISIISAFLLMMMILVVPDTTLWAENATLSLNSSQVKIGDTVTATVSVPADYVATLELLYPADVLEYSSSSVMSSVALGNIGMTLGGPFSQSATISFRAIKSSDGGNVNLKVNVIKAGSNSTGDEVSLDGATVSISVVNNTSDGGDNNGGNAGGYVASADNSLSSLKISPGKLSPSFKSGTKKYSVTVENSVTSVVIDAAPSHAKASVVSVTGDKNLAVGANNVKIVVKAENGTTATYTIVVTRKEKPATPPEGGTDTPPQDTQQEQAATTFEVNGQNLKVATEIPPEVIPVDFSLSSVLLDNVDYPSLAFNNGDLMLLYLTNEDGTNGALYVYDNVQNAIYSFVKLLSEKGYIIVLLPAVDIVPENYEENTLSIEGKGFVYAYRAEQMTPDFYHLYGMNSQGESGWYQYDTKEGTYQRFVQSEQEEEVVPQESEDSNDELKELEQWNRLMMIIFIVVIAVLVVIIVVLIVTRGRKKNIDDDDDDFLDELDIIETESTEPIEQSDDDLEE